jgi:hypothetical protein
VVGLRDQLNRKPLIAAGVIGVAAAALLLVVFFQVKPSKPPAISGIQSYYTTDDGVTWFADDVEKVPPFDHNGSPAVRCHVFKSGASQPFAGYLEKFTSAMRDQLTGATSGQVISPMNGILVKRPGDKQWVPIASAAGSQVVAVKSSSGSSSPVEESNP